MELPVMLSFLCRVPVAPLLFVALGGSFGNFFVLIFGDSLFRILGLIRLPDLYLAMSYDG